MALGLYRNVKFIDENGDTYGVKQYGNRPIFINVTHGHAIAEGLAGHTAVRRFGHNTSVGTTWETLGNISALKTYPAAAEKLKVISSDADDDGDPAGNGARTVTLTGRDGDYATATETVTLNGTTAVETDATFLRV